MLKPLSNLTLDTRFEAKATAGLLASGVTGTWAKLTTPANSNNVPTADLPDSGGKAFIVWNESYRDRTAGKWSPDVHATQQVSLLYGPFRAVTDQVASNGAGISVGDALGVDATGKLKKVTVGGTDVVVAYCTKAVHEEYFLSTKYSYCIEFVTA